KGDVDQPKRGSVLEEHRQYEPALGEIPVLALLVAEVAVVLLGDVELPDIPCKREVLPEGSNKPEKLVHINPAARGALRQRVVYDLPPAVDRGQPRPLLALDRIDSLEFVKQLCADPFVPGSPRDVLRRLRERLAAGWREPELGSRKRCEPGRQQDAGPSKCSEHQIRSRIE